MSQPTGEPRSTGGPGPAGVAAVVHSDSTGTPLEGFARRLRQQHEQEKAADVGWPDPSGLPLPVPWPQDEPDAP